MSPSAATDPLDSSQSLGRLLLQKEKTIETLRMELAESHMRFVEVGKSDGRRIRELEMDLRATHMANAKLAEDNEYFQILLQERTMRGDLAHRGNYHSASASYDQLPGTGHITGEHDPFTTATVMSDRETIRKLETEVSSLQDQNSALTLYINRIITRLLQHESFEGLFENGSVTGENPLNAMSNLKRNNVTSQQSFDTEESRKENAAPSLLSRAGSILGGKEIARPQSMIDQTSSVVTNNDIVPKPPTDATLTTRSVAHPNEDPTTAMRIPLRRAESRHRTYRMPDAEWSSNNAYRGPPSIGSRQSSGQTSPGHAQRRSSYFGNGGPASVSVNEAVESHLRASHAASDSGYSESITSHVPSNAASTGFDTRSISPTWSSSSGPNTAHSSSTGTGTILTGSGPPNTPGRIRTLRLVQEKMEADEAAAAERKKANRNSWMGWFGNGNGNGNASANVIGKVGEMPPPPPPVAQRTQAHWPGVVRVGGAAGASNAIAGSVTRSVSPTKRSGSGAW